MFPSCWKTCLEHIYRGEWRTNFNSTQDTIGNRSLCLYSRVKSIHNSEWVDLRRGSGNVGPYAHHVGLHFHSDPGRSRHAGKSLTLFIASEQLRTGEMLIKRHTYPCEETCFDFDSSPWCLKIICVFLKRFTISSNALSLANVVEVDWY